jgi:hypothetical protein
LAIMTMRDSSHIEAASEFDAPSTPMPTGAPAFRSSTTGAMPTPMVSAAVAQWATPTPAAPSRAISAGLGKRQWATQVRRLDHPRDSNHSTGRHPCRFRQ